MITSRWFKLGLGRRVLGGEKLLLPSEDFKVIRLARGKTIHGDGHSLLIRGNPREPTERETRKTPHERPAAIGNLDKRIQHGLGIFEFGLFPGCLCLPIFRKYDLNAIPISCLTSNLR